MTVYIFGGSNAAMKTGWAENLGLRLLRRVPVQNMALGATNSMTTLIRVLNDVQLVQDDVLVWSNATNDALCLSGRAYSTATMLEYVETIILECRTAGAVLFPC